MPSDDDYEKDPELMAAVGLGAITMLGKGLDGAHRDDDPHHQRLRLAAVEICRQAGLLDILKAISADGELRPPPTWPHDDIVPIGGGPGWLMCAIRTFIPGRGILRVTERIKIVGKPTQDQIGKAYERGHWRLKIVVKGTARGT